MKILDIRRNNLQLLLQTEFKGVQRQMAAQLKRTPAQISQWFAGYRTIREDTARDIERRAGKPAGWLDIDRTALGSDAHRGAAGATETIEAAPQLRTGKHSRWPLSVMSMTEWTELTDDERMELEAALLLAFAEVKRRRRERQEDLIVKPPKRAASG